MAVFVVPFKQAINLISYARHHLDQADKDAVLRVLESDRLTQGPEVDAFEQEFAAKVEAPFAVAFSSGTAALHAACFAAGVNYKSTVLTSALGFVASANAPKYLGADVEFADIDGTWNMARNEILRFPEVDALIPVHFAGLPIDMPMIREKTDVSIIEDACHALGAKTESGPVGNCAHSDFTCFSFHPAKAITTGEGGMVTCKSEEHVETLKRFRNHGFRLSDGWYREQTSLGMNYRLSDIHAALGRSQLRKLDEFIERRWDIAMRYFKHLEGVVELPPYHPHHAWHLFVIRVKARNTVYEALRDRGIQCQVHYVPLYRNPFHATYARVNVTKWGDPEPVFVNGEMDLSGFPNTETYFRECLSLPIYPSLTDEEQSKVIKAVRDVV